MISRWLITDVLPGRQSRGDVPIFQAQQFFTELPYRPLFISVDQSPGPPADLRPWLRELPVPLDLKECDQFWVWHQRSTIDTAHLCLRLGEDHRFHRLFVNFEPKHVGTGIMANHIEIEFRPDEFGSVELSH